MDDSGEWFRYHPLFGSFLRQRCQWELAVELPEIHRAAAESWMAQGFPSEAIHHALAAGDAKMLRDILLNHAWGMFNHSELGLLEQSLAALPWSNLLENPRLILLQAWLMQSQHRYSEVNTLLARAEQEMSVEMDTAMHGDFNALRAQVAINDGDQDEAERLSMVALEELPLANYYSRIVATSVHGEVLHCKGKLTKSLAVMQQTEQMARRHDVWHYALWSIIQQSEILFAQGFLQAAWRARRKPSSWYANSILSSCRCMSSCCASVLSCCGHGRASTRLKLAPARDGRALHLSAAAAAAVPGADGPVLTGARRSG